MAVDDVVEDVELKVGKISKIRVPASSPFGLFVKNQINKMWWFWTLQNSAPLVSND